MPLSRRSLIIVGASALVAPGAFAAAPANGRLAFAVFRGKDKVGEHVMGFTRSGAGLTVSTEVEMRVKLGPIPVFRYAHTATERWREDRFASLTTRTDTNGKVEQVTAAATASGVAIEGPAGRLTAPASAAPLTHWNSAALQGPLFNPQLGKIMKVRAARAGRPARGWSRAGSAAKLTSELTARAYSALLTARAYSALLTNPGDAK